MICATRGAIAAPRSGSSWASRVRRARTSSSDSASSWRTAHSDLGLEERTARDERPQQVELGAEGDHGRAPPCRAGRRADPPPPAPRSRIAGMVDELGGDPGQGIGVGGADEPPLGRVARARLGGRRGRGRCR